MGEEDEGLQDTNLDDLELDGDGNPIETKPDEPKPLDDAQVLEYLKAQGFDAEKMEDLKSQNSSYKGLQRNFDQKNKQLEILRKHPEFNKFLQEAYDGKPPESSGDNLPESFRNMSKEQTEALSQVVKHVMGKDMAGLEEKLGFMITSQLFESKYPDYGDYKDKMFELMQQHGVQGTSLNTLGWLYDLAKGESKPADSPNGDQLKLKPKTKQIGVAPKPGERTGGKVTAPKGSEEAWRQKIDEGLSDEDEEA